MREGVAVAGGPAGVRVQDAEAGGTQSVRVHGERLAVGEVRTAVDDDDGRQGSDDAARRQEPAVELPPVGGRRDEPVDDDVRRGREPQHGALGRVVGQRHHRQFGVRVRSLPGEDEQVVDARDGGAGAWSAQHGAHLLRVDVDLDDAEPATGARADDERPPAREQQIVGGVAEFGRAVAVDVAHRVGDRDPACGAVVDDVDLRGGPAGAAVRFGDEHRQRSVGQPPGHDGAPTEPDAVVGDTVDVEHAKDLPADPVGGVAGGDGDDPLAVGSPLRR